MYWGAGRNCRYSGPEGVQVTSGGIGGVSKGVGAVLGVAVGIRGCRRVRGVLEGWEGLYVLRGQKGYRA